MAKSILAVYDPCPDYIERFLGYAAQKKIGGIRICGFTDIDMLTARISDGRITAVLFFADDKNEGGNERVCALLTKAMREKGLTVMILGEQPAAPFDREGFEFVSKYQRADLILERILKITGSEKDGNDEDAVIRDLHITGIYAPWDKSSHPETAVLAAGMIRREQNGNNRILYINLEPFSGMRTFLDLPEESGLSNVIYYYRTRPEEMARAVKEAAGSFAGMDILTAPANLEDLEEIGREEWPDFLEAVSRAGDYQNIILDTGMMGKQIEDVIFRYGNLFIPAMPYLNTETGNGKKYDLRAYKLKEYRSYIKKTRGAGDLEKIYEIRADADR